MFTTDENTQNNFTTGDSANVTAGSVTRTIDTNGDIKGQYITQLSEGI